MKDILENLQLFKFQTKPFAHQLEAFKRSAYLKYYALFMEQGTGKSKVAIDTGAYLYGEGEIDAILIIAPNGVHENWAQKEFPIHLPSYIPHDMLVWSAKKAKRKKFKEAFKKMITSKGMAIFLMNIDAWSSKKGRDVGRLFLSNRKALMVVDESARIKTPGAKRTQGIITAGKLAKYRRILTGTPVTQGPFDIYSQFKFLSPSITGFTNFNSFKHRYAQLETERNWGTGKDYEVVVGYQNLEELKTKIQPYLFRVTKDQCLDLPPKLYKEIFLEMTEEQEKIYKEIKEKTVVEIEGGELTVKMALVKLLRLQQITGGVIPKTDNPDEEKDYYYIPGTNPKINSLLDIIDETQGKIIIWARFVQEINLIKRELIKALGNPKAVATYYGKTPSEERTVIIDRFQDPDDPLKIFIANAATAGEGLTLTQAKTVIYFSNNFSYSQRVQSEDRAHRIGQDNKVLYIDLVMKNTIDAAVKRVLSNKATMAEYMTRDNIRNIVDGE